MPISNWIAFEHLPKWLVTSGKVSAAIALVIIVLWLIGGVWPPFAAMHSDSMAPTLRTGDLVYITQGPPSEQIQAGDIILAEVPSMDKPLIHRAVIRVEEGENWVNQVNQSHLSSQNCSTQRYCPAPYNGLITKGDANQLIDQSNGTLPIIRPEWINGQASAKVPLVGLLHVCISNPDTC
jgi:signal peptidase